MQSLHSPWLQQMPLHRSLVPGNLFVDIPPYRWRHPVMAQRRVRLFESLLGGPGCSALWVVNPLSGQPSMLDHRPAPHCSKTHARHRLKSSEKVSQPAFAFSTLLSLAIKNSAPLSGEVTPRVNEYPT